MSAYFAGTGQPEVLIRLVLTATALAIAVAAPFIGGLIGRLGSKRVLVWSALLYTAAGASGLVINDLVLLLASRLVLGAAVSGVMVSTITLLTDWHTGTSRNKVLGVQAAFSGLGGVVFLSLGGLFAGDSWRGPFGIYLLALPIAIFIVLFVKEPARGGSLAHPSRQNTGNEASTDGGEGEPASPALVISLFALAFVSQIIFYTIPTQLPFHLATVTGSGAATAGFVMAWMVAVQSGASVTYRYTAKWGSAAHALISFSLMGTGLVVLALAGSLPPAVIGLSITALGTGLIMPNLNAWIALAVPGEGKAKAFGGLTSAMFAGQFVSPLLAQPLIINNSIAPVYLAAAGLAAAVAVILLLQSFASKSRTHEPSPPSIPTTAPATKPANHHTTGSPS
jgi:MFS family permease